MFDSRAKKLYFSPPQSRRVGRSNSRLTLFTQRRKKRSTFHRVFFFVTCRVRLADWDESNAVRFGVCLGPQMTHWNVIYRARRSTHGKFIILVWKIKKSKAKKAEKKNQNWKWFSFLRLAWKINRRIVFKEENKTVFFVQWLCRFRIVWPERNEHKKIMQSRFKLILTVNNFPAPCRRFSSLDKS